MDYEKAAQDLFERLLGALARCGDTVQFCDICAKYPQLLAEWEQKAEEGTAKIQLPDGVMDQVRGKIREITDTPERKNLLSFQSKID